MSLIPPKYRDWIPVRQHSTAHWRCYQSRNGKIFLSVDGDIYLFNLNAGNLIIAWENLKNRKN